jgi:hypothetical protein
MGPKGALLSHNLADTAGCDASFFKLLIAKRFSGPSGNCIDGVVYNEFVPPRQTVNGHFYMQVLQRLRDAVRS